MDTFKQFMTETKFYLPNWSWLAIALVVIAVIIIIACTVAVSRKKKRAQIAEENSVVSEPEYGEKTDVESDGYDKLIEPFYPAPENTVVYEGSHVENDEITAPVEEAVIEQKEEYSEPVESHQEQPAEEIEYHSEQVEESGHVDEVTYSAVVTPVEQTKEEPAKKTTAKKKTSGKKTAAKKSTAKKPAAKKAAAKKPAAKKTETKPVEEVKEEATEQPATVTETAEKKPTKKTTAKKTAASKNTTSKKPAAEKKPAKAKPVKSESVPTVSEILTEDIPEPVQTQPEVTPAKPKAKQAALKEDKKEAVKAKAEPEKKAEKKPAKKTEAKPKKSAAAKPAAKKPAKSTATKKPKIEIVDVAATVASANPTGEEKVYHVSKRPQDNKWEIRIEGSSKAIKLFRTKKEAEEYAIPLAGDDTDNVRVVIHRADGRPKNIAYL